MELSPDYLANALRQEAGAKAELQAQQAQQQRLQQQADAPIPQAGRNGSFLDTVAGYVRRDRMNDKLNQMQPKLKRAREQYAQNYGSGDIYDARVDRAAAEEEQRRYALKRARQQRLDQQETARDQRNYKAEQREITHLGTFLDPADPTKPAINAFRRADGSVVDSEGNPVSLRGLEERGSAAGGGGGSGRVYSWEQKRASELYDRMSNIERAMSISEDFTPEELATLEDLQPRLKKAAIKAVTPEAFTELVKGEYDDMTPRMREFMNEVAYGGSQLRNELFGSALTTNEQRSSNEFIANAPGIRLSAIKRRLGTTFKDARDGLQNLDTAKGPDSDYLARVDDRFGATRTYLRAQQEAKNDGDGDAEAQEKGLKAGVQKLIDNGNFSGDDLEALKWARDNPNTPEAQEFFEIYSQQGGS